MPGPTGADRELGPSCRRGGEGQPSLPISSIRASRLNGGRIWRTRAVARLVVTATGDAPVPHERAASVGAACGLSPRTGMASKAAKIGRAIGIDGSVWPEIALGPLEPEVQKPDAVDLSVRRDVATKTVRCCRGFRQMALRDSGRVGRPVRRRPRRCLWWSAGGLSQPRCVLAGSWVQGPGPATP